MHSYHMHLKPQCPTGKGTLLIDALYALILVGPFCKQKASWHLQTLARTVFFGRGAGFFLFSAELPEVPLPTPSWQRHLSLSLCLTKYKVTLHHKRWVYYLLLFLEPSWQRKFLSFAPASGGGRGLSACC